MAASQIEFPLAVSVCAWCKPKERGAVMGSLSHGICLRHLKKLKLDAHGFQVKRTRRERHAGLSRLESPGNALPLVF